MRVIDAVRKKTKVVWYFSIALFARVSSRRVRGAPRSSLHTSSYNVLYYNIVITIQVAATRWCKDDHLLLLLLLLQLLLLLLLLSPRSRRPRVCFSLLFRILYVINYNNVCIQYYYVYYDVCAPRHTYFCFHARAFSTCNVHLFTPGMRAVTCCDIRCTGTYRTSVTQWPYGRDVFDRPVTSLETSDTTIDGGRCFWFSRIHSVIVRSLCSGLYTNENTSRWPVRLSVWASDTKVAMDATTVQFRKGCNIMQSTQWIFFFFLIFIQRFCLSHRQTNLSSTEAKKKKKREGISNKLWFVSIYSIVKMSSLRKKYLEYRLYIYKYRLSRFL